MSEVMFFEPCFFLNEKEKEGSLAIPKRLANRWSWPFR